MLCGGDSRSDSTTNNVDARVVGGNQSVNVSNQSGNVHVLATDYGSVERAFEFGQSAIDGVRDTTQKVFSQSVESLKDANKQIAAAYETAKASDQKVLKIGGFIIVGLAVAKAFSGK